MDRIDALEEVSICVRDALVVALSQNDKESAKALRLLATSVEDRLHYLENL